MYQLLSGKINLCLRVWVKCGFSSTATSAFYIFKIRTSAFYPRPNLHGVVCCVVHNNNTRLIRLNSAELNSTSICGRRCKTPQCPHLSSHFCISSTSVNLIRVLICRRFQSGRPQNHITSRCIQTLFKRALNR